MPTFLDIGAVQESCPLDVGAIQSDCVVPCDIAVTPDAPAMEVGSSIQFSASGTSTEGGVTWSVSLGGGSITSGGLYTAPNTNGAATVRATSVSDPTCWDETVITVQHACENFPPQMWLFTPNREIARWQPECHRDLQVGADVTTGAALPNWIYSTGWDKSPVPERMSGLLIDGSGDVRIKLAKTVSGVPPSEARETSVSPFPDQDEVWHEAPSDIKSYRWRLEFSGSNQTVLRKAKYARAVVSAVGG